MSDTADSQDVAEALDSDKLPGDHDDPDAEPEYPLDVPIGVNQFGFTSAEEEVDEPIAERVERESTDPLVVELDAEVLIEDFDGQSSSPETYVEPSEALETNDLGNPAGRLEEWNEDEDGQPIVDDEGQSLGRAVNAGEDSLSAEEAAMHLSTDPPFDVPDDARP
ncbi:MAG: hypothetical protein WBA45_01645 [Microthrixaceae bacterium]